MIGDPAVLLAEVCPYCGAPTRRSTGKTIYPHRVDLYRKRFVTCTNYPECDAYVGTHKDGRPLGRLANQDLRQAKQHAHRLFDRLWQPGPQKVFSRRTAYRWLAGQLNIDIRLCHIGMFDLTLCQKTIDLCTQQVFTSKEISNGQECS